jgi:hypothetical protein
MRRWMTPRGVDSLGRAQGSQCGTKTGRGGGVACNTNRKGKSNMTSTNHNARGRRGGGTWYTPTNLNQEHAALKKVVVANPTAREKKNNGSREEGRNNMKAWMRKHAASSGQEVRGGDMKVWIGRTDHSFPGRRRWQGRTPAQINQTRHGIEGIQRGQEKRGACANSEGIPCVCRVRGGRSVAWGGVGVLDGTQHQPKRPGQSKKALLPYTHPVHGNVHLAQGQGQRTNINENVGQRVTPGTALGEVAATNATHTLKTHAPLPTQEERLTAMLSTTDFTTFTSAAT